MERERFGPELRQVIVSKDSSTLPVTSINIVIMDSSVMILLVSGATTDALPSSLHHNW